ncbi:MAG: hypothetical protein GYA24_23800 [Candidatus Lokiarchaeota archaeon]|nr:hypothetical protein [Candidatus Lokiarchaeota archaeon]
MILLGWIEVASQRLDMIRAPVRVRVAASKISCKQCGREYTRGDLASLTICESCGSDLSLSGIAIEMIQQALEARQPGEDILASALDAEKLAARISVKRYELRSGTGSMHRDANLAASPAIQASRAPAAAWIKVKVA